MPIFTKHRAQLFTQANEELLPNQFELGKFVEGFSNRNRKPESKALSFVVTEDNSGEKQFTLKGMF